MTNIEEFDANKAFPFKSGSFVGIIIFSAIAVGLFYFLIFVQIMNESPDETPTWL